MQGRIGEESLRGAVAAKIIASRREPEGGLARQSSDHLQVEPQDIACAHSPFCPASSRSPQPFRSDFRCRSRGSGVGGGKSLPAVQEAGRVRPARARLQRRERVRQAARRHRVAHRAAAERSRLRRPHHAGHLRGDGAGALRAVAAGLGGAGVRADLLRPQRPPAPLWPGVRAAVFLGHRQGKLHPARGPHRAGHASARRAWPRPASPAPRAIAPGPGSRAAPAARSRPASRPASRRW